MEIRVREAQETRGKQSSEPRLRDKAGGREILILSTADRSMTLQMLT